MESLKTYSIAVVGNIQLALGFKLSGVAEVHSPANASEAESVMRQLLQSGDTGLIITTSKIIKLIRDRKLSEQIANSALPMVIEVPEYKEEGQPDTLRKLILRAIGIDIGKNA